MQDGRHCKTPRGRQSLSTALLAAADLKQGKPRGVSLGSGTDRLEILLVRTGPDDSDIAAFENACPHAGTPLDNFPDQFMTRDGQHLLCATHGARFRPEDGFCISGPCKGQSLKPLAVEVVDQEICLTS